MNLDMNTLEQTRLTAGNIKYLLAFNELIGEGKTNGIKCIEIAKVLKVSKPSVHSMVLKLQKFGFINKDRYGSVFLTERGYHFVTQYNKYFIIVFEHFKKILPKSVDTKSLTCSFLSEIEVENLPLVAENILTLEKYN